MFGFIEWFYWMLAFFINAEEKLLVNIFYVFAILIAAISILSGCLSIGTRSGCFKKR